jgi:hypothetical protein
MWKRYGQETEETHEKAGAQRIAEGAVTPNHEDGQEYKDLEFAALADELLRLYDRNFSKRPDVDGRLRHSHRVRSGCHRCGFVPKKREEARQGQRLAPR